jgi:ketosteroid isomerase-like protein
LERNADEPWRGDQLSATKVEVAKAGDLAYVSGTYEETMTDARGKYLETFKKQADGTWKCIRDIWNSDLPASATAENR